MRIFVLSSRPDLVSGGSALVQIKLPPRARRLHWRVRVKVGKRAVRRRLFHRSGSKLTGLITGLRLGRNVLKVRLPDGTGARITLVNHRIGGPVFSGPQLHPWKCQATAKDAQCNQPPSFSYVYMPKGGSGFKPYDPASPPSDVGTTTTDQGVRVPFIVRVETGYMDRDQYKVATLFRPGTRWSWSRPQRQFNHKLLITHGASCDVDYETGSAPSVTSFNPLPSEVPPGAIADGVQQALGRGFMVMSTALDNSGHDCNVAVQAESLEMAKEHIVKSYGTLRYTIGTGCSGGSLAQQWIANAYPGIYQGILPTCSFPDAWTSATQVGDYALLENYFFDPTRWGLGVAWSPSQIAAIEGNALPVDAFVSVGCVQFGKLYQNCFTGYFSAAVPTHPCGGISNQQRYDPKTNPGGVRCSLADGNVNLLGRRPPSVWGPQEKKLGHGFAGLPIDNVGVQYGLGALRSGQITASQFVDLNAKIGGSDIDLNPTPSRLVADGQALANAYRTGLINVTNNLNRTAIIDCRGPDPGAAHDSYRAFAVRARLDREHGTHANQLIWEGAAPIIGDNQCNWTSFIAMDRWLTAIEKDHGRRQLAEKILRDKPSDLSDRCYDGKGVKLSDGLCPGAVVPVYGTPRMVAGDPITTDANKCQLKPLSRSDYPVSFTASQWAQLQSAFPNGVCDFSKPGVDQQPTIAWQTYQTARGKVIYGGKPLGPAPASKRHKSKRRHGKR